MRNKLLIMLLMAAGGAIAGEGEVYSLGTPGVPILYVGSSGAADNSWLEANSSFMAQSFEYVRTSDVVESLREVDPAAPVRSLASASVGFPIERNKPEYYLGDALIPPDDVDWDQTYALFENSEFASNFLFDTKGRCVYVINGATSRFSWVTTGGITQEVAIVASPVSAERPKNIFWTDNGGKPVDLTGKYVRLFGPNEILEKVIGYRETGTTIGDEKAYQEYVVKGLYIDESGGKKTMYAAGELSGQVVLVYYDSATYERIVGVQTIEVSRPSVETLTAFVGSELKPTGRGFSSDGLIAAPASLEEDDDGKGPYLYQHSGKYSYSPKNGCVFALRPTSDKTRNRTQIFWMETDAQAVQWPFEIDEYLVDWSEKTTILVRGDADGNPGKGITIPSAYDSELMKYQEDFGSVKNHARAPVDGEFVTYGPGLSLLKLTADDNIWFMPVRSIMRDDLDWFDPYPVEYDVGEEVVIAPGEFSGIAKNKASWFDIDTDIPGYIYEPVSDRVWNKNVYSASGVGAGGLPSAIFPVTAPMDDSTPAVLEVWWSASYQEDGMPEAVSIPKLPQTVNVAWPYVYSVPKIVLASQKGSAEPSVFLGGKTLMLCSENSSLGINNRKFFSSEGGVISFWINTLLKEETTGNGRIVTFGDENGDDFITIDMSNDCEFTLHFGSAEPVTLQGGMGESGWNYVVLAWDEENLVFVVADPDWDFLDLDEIDLAPGDSAIAAGILCNNSIGASEAAGTVPYCMIDRFECINSLDFDPDDQESAFTVGDADTPGYTLSLDFDASVVRFFEDGAEEEASVDVYDKTLGTVHCAEDCILYFPGSPRNESVVIDSDTVPVIYREDNPEAIGYNPNEEHAFVEAVPGGYVVWALRNDLNEKCGVSEPGVLVSYTKDGKAKMRYFAVVATNDDYPTLGASCKVGNILPGPHPLDFFADPWLADTYWDNDALPPFRDRKGQVWAKENGGFDIYMYYAQQDAFDWPGMRKPAAGESVPWLAYLDGGNGIKPYPWHWEVEWPDEDEADKMKIGQTLTVAENNLPEVWNAKSMAVLYPDNNGGNTVMLSDPTVAVKVSFDVTLADLKEIGLEATPEGKLLEKQGMYYFRDVSPSLSDRLYIDPTAKKLCLKGKKESNPGGIELLHVNVLTEANQAEVLALIDSSFTSTATYGALQDALKELLGFGPQIPTEVTKKIVNRHEELVDTYKAPDHYALTALGDTNWVVIIENNATNRFCDAGNPINMHVFKVKDEYYTGRIATREDPLNKLSQVLGVHYSANFGGKAGDYIFEWRKAGPERDGTKPTDYVNGFTVAFSPENSCGRTEFTIGGQGDTLANMVNTYWTCRYKACSNTVAYATMGERWSDWTDAALAEGWVQRVLNNVTPFTQRMTDLYENTAETTVSMIAQAGAPYTGDVALNQDNLTSIGLIQLYRTLLNKAKSMSVDQGVNNEDANKQLLLAAERLADLYQLLGDEAYSDALNPTISIASNSDELEWGVDLVFGSFDTAATFCFDNQVPTLLDEELALLRGRSCVNAPGNTAGPYYNRLVWNFTKGITAGEVAYALNYSISGHRSSTIDETTAAAQFPQGHGDAYGHYLSALKGYYELLRHPYFSWGVVAMGEMNVADNVVNVDYYDEATFAKAAASLARTARRTVELTALKHWRDKGADSVGGGYLDSNVTNAFGYGEWATRGGYGALCNWVVANSLLPEEEEIDDDGEPFTDKGLLRIDRGTVDGIGELSSAAEAIQQTLDKMDSGLNPIGLDECAIPFDLTPLGTASSQTHYEQVRERAEKAMENAREILDEAQELGSRLQLLHAAQAGMVDNLDEDEDDLTAQLISIYGRPYTDDCGPSGTYPQDYSGPDRYHYMWMDLSKFGLTDVADTLCVTTVTYKVKSFTKDGKIKDFVNDPTEPTTGNALSYSLSATGVAIMPPEIRGERPAAGSLQQAYADFLSAYANVKNAMIGLERAQERMNNEQKLAYAQLTALKAHDKVIDDHLDADNASIRENVLKLRSAQQASATLEALMDQTGLTIEEEGELSGTVGLATTLLVDGAKVASGIVMGIIYTAASAGKVWADCLAADYDAWIQRYQIMIDRADFDYSTATDMIDIWDRALDAVDDQAAAVAELRDAWCALESAQLQVSQLIQDAKAIEGTLELVRQQTVNNISKMRYNDMFLRLVRNESLSRYETSFDLARRYAFLTAKAYGYETGSPLSSSDEGSDILRSIIAARSPGDLDDALGQLDDNWSNIKPQLGLNNPQNYATWFSLRHGLFRILKDELGDEAWKKELSKHWVEDIKTDPEFRRYCQPFASQFGTAEKEPALVIPFETTIDFARNLFGLPLAFDDKQFDSSWFATKIMSAGVWFEGYNEKRPGYTGQSSFATTPNVYLVPVGRDRMRTPGSDGEEIAEFDVVDQTIPVPYPVTAAELAEANWLPTYSGEFGGVDKETRIRRHPSFRAYFGNRGEEPSGAQLDATRLTGRSVWNTRWLLVIPAGTLSSDREAALKAFIYGLDTNRDGIADVNPVSDILIGFKTYSNSGK